jgi:subtilase family serine protease
VVTNIEIQNQGATIFANDTYLDGTPYFTPVQVVIENIGNHSAGQFNVRFENHWVTGGGQLETLLTQTVMELVVEENVTLTFLWRPAHTQNYSLTVTADCDNDIEEENEDDNVTIKPNLIVTMIGDVTSDGIINIFDAVVVGLAWGANPQSSNWNIQADLNHDNQINILDAVRISLHWGKTW